MCYSMVIYSSLYIYRFLYVLIKKMNPDIKDKATGASAPSGSSGALTPKPGVSAPADAQGTYEIEVIGGMIFSRLLLLFTRH